MEAPIADGGQGKQMDRITGSGSAVTDDPDSTAQRGKRHFDTFETQFFRQGDDSESAPEVDRFEDLDDGRARRRFVLPRQFVLGVAAGTVCLAVIGCVALWRSGNRSNQTNQESPVASSEPASPGNTAVAAPAAAPEPAAPSGAPSVEPLAAGVPAPIPAAPPARAEPPPAVAAAAKPEPSAQAAAGHAAAEGPAPKAEQPAAPAMGDAAAARTRCKDAVSRRRWKDVQLACEEAFAADSSAADIAILLAKAEFDRGRSARAEAWSRKALAADPNAADAYVFIGGVEQNAGRNKAAKEAYRRYLQLAPNGRYAADLRAIVSSL